MSKLITLLSQSPEPTGPALTTSEEVRIQKLRAEIKYLTHKREMKIKELAELVGPPAPIDLAKEFGNVE